MKKLFLQIALPVVLCIYLVSCTSTETVVAQEILLSQDWAVQSSAKIGQDGKALSSSGINTKDWYPASVPSTVMGTLTQNGLYKDLLIGTNYKDADKSIFDVSWWYRTNFKLPKIEKGEHIKLQFDGLTYRANIWLNGEQIASKDDVYGPFCRFSFDITNKVQNDNVLAVEIFRAQSGEPNIGFVDWNPRPLDENMGIFREVRVVVSGAVEMNNTWVQSKVNTETLNEAWLNIETQLVNDSDKEVKGNLEGQIEGITFLVPVSLSAKEKKTVKITPEEVKGLNIKNPRLWWCNNMGTPELYDLELKFVTDNKISAQDKITFGIRQVETYLTEGGHKGFKLNGKKVLIKSAGWTDDIFLRDTPMSNETQVQYVKDMNLNMIRFENVWGTSRNIYELCDHYGLMALVGWSCQWEWNVYYGTPDDEFGSVKTEADMELLTRFLNDQVTWLRNHPSIIAWMVGSDKLPRPELEKKYLELYPKIDDRPYIGAAKGLESPLSGKTGMKMLGPYEYVGANYWFLDTNYGGAYGFNTETGPGPQLPVMESIEKMIPQDKLWPINNTWNYHCTTAPDVLNSLDVLTKAIDGTFGKSQNLDQYLNRAHLLNYQSTKSMFEAFRLNKAEATGIVQWMLNSAWPSLYWQLYDYYMIPAPAYYGVKEANEPVQLIYNYKDNGIYIVNESVTDMKDIKAVIRGFSIDSKSLYEKEITISVNANGVSKIYEIDNTAKNSFLFLSLSDNQNKFISENFYTLSAHQDTYFWDKTDWVGTPMSGYSDFKDLDKLPKSELKIKVTSEGNEKNSLSVEIENPSSTIAFFTQSLLKDTNGEVVYPVYWNNNYISILPGEKKVLNCVFDHNSLNSKPAKLQIKGWNIDEQIVNLD